MPNFHSSSTNRLFKLSKSAIPNIWSIRACANIQDFEIETLNKPLDI